VSNRLLALTTTAVVLGAAAPAAAQLPSAGSVELTPYAGYMIFDHLVNGPLGTNLGNANGPLYGVQLGVPVLPGLKLVGNLAYSDTDLKVGVPILGGVNFGQSTAVFYDGGLQLGLPVPIGNLSPFLQAGAGGIYQEISISGVTTNANSFAWNLGGGVDMALVPGVALRLMARDYFGKFDYRDATLLDLNGRTMNNIALTAGVRVAF